MPASTITSTNQSHSDLILAGQTPSAGSCLLSVFRKDGQKLLIGMFVCPEEDRFDDTLQLFNQIVLK